MEKLTGISIRVKLLLLLTVVPILTLALYLAFASHLFRTDKIAYVFDSSSAGARAVSTQVRTQLEVWEERVREIAAGFHKETGSFNAVSVALFRESRELDSLTLYRSSGAGLFRRLGSLQRPGLKGDRSESKPEFLESARRSGIAMAYSGSLLLGIRVGEVGSPGELIGVLSIPGQRLAELFKSGETASYLVAPGGAVILGPEKAQESDFSGWEFFRTALKKNLSDGTAEVVSPSGRPMLVSYSQVGAGDLRVVSLIERDAVLRAVSVLLTKSLLFFVALISAATLISVFASSQLTATLRELFAATLRVSSGDFNIQVAVRSKDEVGGLAAGFNRMAGEISTLVKGVAVKARMESELETARLVQKTLFPAPNARSGQMAISGFYEPASECGGDWWHYCEIGDKLFLWIGDATGHGAPAALITSAAKSAAAVIEKLKPDSAEEVMALMNHAIHEIARSQMLMTFFVGCIDRKSGILAYCNASHDPPFLMRHSEVPLKKKDLITLNEVVNPRLGEAADSRYQQAMIQLAPGDTLAFYTDGLAEVRNAQGEMWGELGFVKALVSSFSGPGSPETAVTSLREKMSAFRGEADLKDDVTFFACRYERAS